MALFLLRRPQRSATTLQRSRFFMLLAFISLIVVVTLLSGCGAPFRPEHTPASTQLPAVTATPDIVSAPPSPLAPAPSETMRPISADELMGVWSDTAQDYLFLQETGAAELYLASANEIYDLTWTVDSTGTIALSGEEPVQAQAEGEPDAVRVSLQIKGIDIALSHADLAQRDRIRHDTGCGFLGDWDMYTVTQVETGMVASFRSDGSCTLYGAEFTWRPGVAGYEERDGISIYLYDELYYILIGSETPMGDRAYLSKKDYSHWHSSAMLQRVGTELELPVVEDLGNG